MALALEFAAFAASAVGSAALLRFICRRTCPHTFYAWREAVSSDDSAGVKVRLHGRQSLRLQVSCELLGGVVDDEFEDMVVELSKDVRTVGDVMRALAASITECQVDHKRLLARCHQRCTTSTSKSNSERSATIQAAWSEATLTRSHGQA